MDNDEVHFLYEQLNSSTKILKIGIDRVLKYHKKFKNAAHAVVFGFYLGILSSSKKNKLTETDILELLNLYFSNVGKYMDLDSLLTKTIFSFSNYFNNQPKCEDINYYPINTQEQLVVESNKNLEKRNETGITQCKICLEDYDIYEPQHFDLDCGCIVHDKCFDTYVEGEVKGNKIPIKCPICRKDVRDNFIYDSLTTRNLHDLVTKFQQYTLNYFALNHKEEVSCCPTPGCDYIFYFNKDDYFLDCPNCNKEYCLKCKVEWHKEMTCQEYRQLVYEKTLDDEFYKFVKGAKYKMCPNCKIWVEKTEGCNHMKCKCGNEFCYNCGKNRNIDFFHVCDIKK